MCPPDGSSSTLLRFYDGSGTDHRGRTVADIVAWDDGRLENVHDFIQWLFPLDEPSAVNPYAPLVTPGDQRAFAGNPELRRRLLASFTRMLAFYGFVCAGPAPVRVLKASDWASASRRWLTPGNHNYLRITRILKSLKLLGATEHARAFYDALVPVYESNRAAIGETTFEYWNDAAS